MISHLKKEEKSLLLSLLNTVEVPYILKTFLLVFPLRKEYLQSQTTA